MSDVRTPELVINKLSKQQYESIQNPSDTELYLVPEDEEHKPICYPTTASDVKTTSMVLKSSVDGNGRMLTENGFVYNTSGNPTVSDTKVVCDLGVGFMEKKLENLTQNTEYHIKSYGQNANGLAYGSELVQRTTYNPIPAEYQLVEYLESSGTQYINTQFVGINQDSKILAKVYTKTYTQSIQYPVILGCNSYQVDAYNSFQIGYNSNTNTLILDVGTNRNSIAPSPINYLSHNLYEISINNNEFKINDILIANYQTNNFNTNVNLSLFNNFPHNNNTFFIGRFVFFKLLDSNNQYIRRMYPVYRIADNKPGMYDIVNGAFYTNQGTGEFVVGPDAVWSE